MNVGNLVTCAIWLAILLVLLPRIRAIWRGGEALHSLERTWSGMWPYGTRSLRAWVRALIPIYACGYFLLFMTVGVFIRQADRQMRPFLAGVALIRVIGTITMVALAASIILFNRPKWLVIPTMRSDDGLLTRVARRPDD